MAAPQLSQKEYLKKYLMLGNNEKKKKKKSKKTSHERFRIVDDDIDLKNMRPLDDDEEVGLYNLAEDTPQIVGVIDDRPEEMRIVEEFRESKRWKVMCDELNKDSMGDVIGLSKKDMKSVRNATMDQSNSVSGFSKSKYDKGPNDIFQISNSRNHLDISSSKKQKSHGDSDVSSPRRQRVHNDSDESPSRKQKRHNDSDVSPPRKRRANTGSDTSPPRRSRKLNDSDTSPRRRDKTDLSPARKQRSNNDSDSSPPRKQTTYGNLDTSPPRRKGSDLSPSRKPRTHSDSLPKKSHYAAISPNMSRDRDDDGTISSPKRHKNDVGNKIAEAHTSNSRKSKYNSRWSPSHKNQNKYDSSPKEKSSSYSKSRNNDMSDLPPRRRKGISLSGSSDSDNSPPRISKRSRNTSDLTDIPRTDRYEKNVLKKMEKTLDGKKAGLQDSREIQQEISNFKRREEEMFAQMDDEISGRVAGVVMRDRKTGKRRNLEEETRQKQQEEEKMAEYKEKYSRWGKGLKQVEEQKANLQQALHEMSKPLARYANDDDLEQHLRNQEREGDPMLDYIRSKKTEDNVKSKPKYQGSFLPNRFGIPPGHRWDGVDRSNGYEKKWFEEQNSRKAVEEQAYKWSTSEM